MPHQAGRDSGVRFSRVRLALIVSLALSVVLMTQVAVGFDPLRVKLVRSPQLPLNGVARVQTVSANSTKTPSAPFAVIARIQNDSPRTARFVIRVDGRVICARNVSGGGTTRRIDCAVTGGWDVEMGHALEVVGERDIAWKLAYLEIATHHGSTRGFDLIIVPADSKSHERPTVPAVVLSFLAIAAAFLLPPAAMPRGIARLHAGLSLVIAVVLLLIVLSPRVSAYSVLLSAKAVGEIALVLMAPRVWFAGDWMLHKRKRGSSRALACAAAGLVVMAAYGAVVGQLLHDEYGGNYSGFVQLSRAVFDRHPVLSGSADVRRSLVLKDHGGYDGQFMYYMTFDPFLRTYKDDPATYRLFIDAPPYRVGRIGFSVLTRLFSAGQWSRYPKTMMWLILGSLFVCGFALASLAESANATAAWGLLIIIIPGFWQSIQVALPEPVAAAMLLGAASCLVHRCVVVAGLLFGVSLLTRETGAILAVTSAAALLLSGKRRDGVRVLLISLTPLLLWRLYVGWMLFPEWGTKAFFFNAQNLGLPFLGLVDLWSTIRQGTYFPEEPAISRAGLLYWILLCFGLILALVAAVRRPGAATVAAVLYGVIAVSFTYHSIWVHVGNAQRGTYELFVSLALVTLETRNGPRPLRWSLGTFWAATALYVFVGAFDADLIRNAIL